MTRLRCLTLLAAVSALFVSATADASPFRADVADYGVSVSPAVVNMTVYTDNHVVIAPMTARIHFVGTELHEGDTATARFDLGFDPDQSSYTFGLSAPAQTSDQAGFATQSLQ